MVGGENFRGDLLAPKGNRAGARGPVCGSNVFQASEIEMHRVGGESSPASGGG